jgi:hypothetical protein
MDTGQRFARITLKTIRVHGFDHIANWPAKVRNVPMPGSQTFGPLQTLASRVAEIAKSFLPKFESSLGAALTEIHLKRLIKRRTSGNWSIARH